jgi:mRNA interferase MazF
MVIERFAVFLVALDPAQGAETMKTRPCVIVSPDDVNDALATVIIAPMTTVRRHWPTRPSVTFQGKTGEIALDQLRGGQGAAGQTSRQDRPGHGDGGAGYPWRTVCSLN